MGCDAYRGELKPFQNHKGRQPTDAIGFLPLHFTSGSCLQYLVAPEVSELAIPGKPASPVNRARIATE